LVDLDLTEAAGYDSRPSEHLMQPIGLRSSHLMPQRARQQLLQRVLPRWIPRIPLTRARARVHLYAYDLRSMTPPPRWERAPI
jgi:hypothetical protein